MYTVAGNFGLPLGETGFLNLTGEYGNSLPTDRSVQRDDATALIKAGNTDVRDPAQIWGSPEVMNDIKVWANTGYVLDNDMQVYGHGSYASKQVEGGFYFRNPNTRSGVFGTSDDDGAFLLVGDLLDAEDGVLDGSAGCPRVAVSGGVVTDQAAWDELMANDHCWTFQKMFPGGFTPQFGANVFDASAVAGLKGVDGQLHWDVSAAWGNSNMDFYMYNTVNSSLGPDQPCATDQELSPHVPDDQRCTPYFNPGIYDQQETNLNVDLSYAMNERVNLAGGAEFRNERFEIVPGDTASWTEGSLAEQGFTPGSNGFTGFGPLTEGNWNRNNVAAYADVELRDPEGAWTLGVAGRFERFSDFGSTRTGKFAGRVSLSEEFALRMSASTGFRAPTPGQSNAFNVSTIYDPVIMDLTNNGTIPPTSALGMEYEGEALTPETSISLAWGGVFESGGLSMSFDAYQIQMSDRLTFSQDFNLSPGDIQRLLDEGIIRPGGVLARFRFFVNDFETRSRGIDWVAAYRVARGDGSSTAFSTAWNLNRTEVTQHDTITLSKGRIRILEEGLPNIRGNIAVTHAMASGTSILVRASHWGGYFDGEQPYYDPDDPYYSPGDPEYDPAEPKKLKTIDYAPRNLIDIEVTHPVMDRWTLTVGAQNVLGTYPQEYPGAAAGVGNTYGQFTPFGFNGGFYYTRLGYSW